MQWQASLFKTLVGQNAPRVLTFGDIFDLAKSLRSDVARSSVDRFIKKAQGIAALRQVRRGLWLNARALPSPSLAEAADHVRAGAIVSLQSVLGDAGILNNFTPNVYCVLPDEGERTGVHPHTGEVVTSAGRFVFKSLSEQMLTAGDKSDRLVPMISYARATPEAALVHWICLAKSRGSSVSEPDTQCDVSLLDMERLERLATAVGVKDRVFDWMERCRQREQDDDEHAGWGPGGL